VEDSKRTASVTQQSARTGSTTPRSIAKANVRTTVGGVVLHQEYTQCSIAGTKGSTDVADVCQDHAPDNVYVKHNVLLAHNR
jgi:hypothetical protein